MSMARRLWGVVLREGSSLEPVARGCPASTSLVLGLSPAGHSTSVLQPGSTPSVSARHVSTSTCSHAKFQSVLRKRGAPSRLYTRENLQEWQRSQYDLVVGSRLVEQALAGAGRAQQRGDRSLNIQALQLINRAPDLPHLRQVVVEVGLFLDAFCLVAAVSRVPRLVRVTSAGPSAPGSLWHPSQLVAAKEQQQMALLLVDRLLPLLQPRLGDLTAYQVGMLVFALGEVSYSLHPEQQPFLLSSITAAATTLDLEPRTASALLLGCAKLDLPTWSPPTWTAVMAAAARCSATMTLQQLVQALKALCIAAKAGGEATDTPSPSLLQSLRNLTAPPNEASAHRDALVHATSERIHEYITALQQPGAAAGGATASRSGPRTPGGATASGGAEQLPDLVHVAHALRSLHLLLPSGAVPVPLFQAVAAVLPSRCATLPVSGLIAVVQAYCYTGLGTPPLNDALCTACAMQVSKFSPDQLHLVLLALTHAKVQHGALAKLVADMTLIHGPGRTLETADTFALALERTHSLGLWDPTLLQRAAPKVAAASSLVTAVGMSSLLKVATGLVRSAADPGVAADVTGVLGQAVRRHAEMLPTEGAEGLDRLCGLLGSLQEVGAAGGVDVRGALVEAAEAAVACGGWKQAPGPEVAHVRAALAKAGISWHA